MAGFRLLSKNKCHGDNCGGSFMGRSRLSAAFKRNPAAYVMLLVLGLYFVTRLINLKGVPVFIDESIYIKWARAAQGGNLWASLLYDGKPPLHSWAMVPLLSLMKDELLAGRLTSVFFGGMTTLGLYLTGKELRNWKLGALAAFLYVACPFTFFYDRMAIAEGMLLTLFVFAVYFAVKAARSVNSYYLIGAGVCTGLALLTKGTATLLFLIVPFAYLIRGPAEKGLEKSRPLVRWLATSGLALLLGFGILNLLRFSSQWAARSTFIATRSKNLHEILATPLRQFLRFNSSIIVNLLTYLTPILLIVALGGLLIALLKGWRPGYFLLAWFLLGFVVISLVGKFAWARFYLVLAPPLLLSAAYVFYELWAFAMRAWVRAGSKRILATASVAVVAGLAIAAAVPAGSLLAGMTRATQGEADYLKGRCAGTGMAQTAHILRDASRHRKIMVVANDYFIQYALEMYMPNRRNLELTTLNLEYREGYTALLKSTIGEEAREGPTYVIVNGAKNVPSSWHLRVLREFVKDKGRSEDSMFVTRVMETPTAHAGVPNRPL